MSRANFSSSQTTYIIKCTLNYSMKEHIDISWWMLQVNFLNDSSQVVCFYLSVTENEIWYGSHCNRKGTKTCSRLHLHPVVFWGLEFAWKHDWSHNNRQHNVPNTCHQQVQRWVSCAACPCVSRSAEAKTHSIYVVTVSCDVNFHWRGSSSCLQFKINVKMITPIATKKYDTQNICHITANLLCEFTMFYFPDVL